MSDTAAITNLLSSDNDVCEEDDTSNLIRKGPSAFTTIYQIRPQQHSKEDSHRAIHGMGLVITGNSEQEFQFIKPLLYPQYADLVSRSTVVPVVFGPCLKGELVKNIRGRSQYMLVWLWDKDRKDEPNKDDCIEQMESYFDELTRAGIYTVDSVPVFNHEEHFHVMNTWSDIIAWEGYQRMYELSPILQRDGSTLEAFLKVSKNHVYSIWQPGKVPQSIVVEYNLNGYVSPLDHCGENSDGTMI